MLNNHSSHARIKPNNVVANIFHVMSSEWEISYEVSRFDEGRPSLITAQHVAAGPWLMRNLILSLCQYWWIYISYYVNYTKRFLITFTTKFHNFLILISHFSILKVWIKISSLVLIKYLPTRLAALAMCMSKIFGCFGWFVLQQ